MDPVAALQQHEADKGRRTRMKAEKDSTTGESLLQHTKDRRAGQEA